MIYKATEVAAYVVKVSEASGDVITQLKLQKILYYIQGAFLALKGEPAFSDEVLAWKYGPAVYTVFSEYKEFGNSPISASKSDIVISEADQLFIKEIYNRYRGFSPSQLVSITHNEAPWLNTAESDIISNRYLAHKFISTDRSIKKAVD